MGKLLFIVGVSLVLLALGIGSTVTTQARVYQVGGQKLAPDADNNVHWDQLYHSAMTADPQTEQVPGETYTFLRGESSGGIYPTTAVTVYMLTLTGDLTSAQIRYWDGSEHFVSMSFAKTITAAFRNQPATTYDLWQGTIPPHAAGTTIYYWLIAKDAEANAYLKKVPNPNDPNNQYVNPLGQHVRNASNDLQGYVYTVSDSQPSTAPPTHTKTNTSTQTSTATPARTNTATPTKTATPPCAVLFPKQPGFEPGNSEWQEHTEIAPYIVCSLERCGTDTNRTGPHTGQGWAWFGGVRGEEYQTLMQTVSLPNAPGPYKLNFYLWIGRHNTGPGASNYLRVRINGQEAFFVSNDNHSYDAGYKLVSVTVPGAHSPGSLVELSFEQRNDASGIINFNVDDISISTKDCSAICSISIHDVQQDSAFYQFVRCLACKAVISGYTCGGPGEPCVVGTDAVYFRPGLNVTRAQISKMVALAAGLVGSTGGQIFQDVPLGSTFFEPIQQLASRGYIGGYPCGGPNEPCGPDNLPYFRPGANTTRAQLTKIVSETAQFHELPGSQLFADVPEASPFFVWVNRLVNRGISSGYACGGPGEPCDAFQRPYFRPGAQVTRGQTAKIVANTFFPGCVVPGRPGGGQ